MFKICMCMFTAVSTISQMSHSGGKLSSSTQRCLSSSGNIVNTPPPPPATAVTTRRSNTTVTIINSCQSMAVTAQVVFNACFF